jgi:LysR family hydrogen peroxide-inducible transcriptional activator
LHDDQQRHVRLLAAPTPVREISLVIRQDYVRERMINSVADAVKAIIPEEMLNTRLKKFAIKL